MLQRTDFRRIAANIWWRQVERNTIAQSFHASNLAVQDAFASCVPAVVLLVLIGEQTLALLWLVAQNVFLACYAVGVDPHEYFLAGTNETFASASTRWVGEGIVAVNLNLQRNSHKNQKIC